MKTSVRRGEIYNCQLANGAEQKFLVIQNDIGNKYCESLIVVPLTKNMRSRRLLFSLVIEGNAISGLDQDHVALFFHIRTLNKDRFGRHNRLGWLDYHALQCMDAMLELSLGLSTLQRLETRFNHVRRASDARGREIAR
ncbi:MAG: type II toxin-antitoxin system PemK/MazF family toxin [Peptococcaceae bacterium]|nr:type II toxin-antitoxin system PemK/MazF family toxin [Peptococcaceae bacterium]